MSQENVDLVRRAVAAVNARDIDRYLADFRLDIERVEAIDEDRVLAFLHLTASGRTTGIPTPADTTNLYDVVDGKISRIRIFLDRQEGLEAAGLRE